MTESSEESRKARSRPARRPCVKGPALRLNWRALRAVLSGGELDRSLGVVDEVVGSLVKACGPEVRMGEVCELMPQEERTSKPVQAEVIAYREGRVLLMPYGDVRGIGPGWLVASSGAQPRVAVSEKLLGRVLDAMGHPLDGGGPPSCRESYPLHASPPEALQREPVSHALSLGVRALDGVLTIGRGQRVGIFSGSGVGKSTLLGMIARNTTADVNVIALVGERSAEVRKFIERSLGASGLARSVVVVASGAEPPMVRIRAAYAATAIAEYFRDRGAHVLLMMDSLTRFAQAQRDVGLAAGEPANAQGYTPTVFTSMPQLLERSGTAPCGSITGLYTVLVEGDDFNEPVSDTARGLLDGHVMLSRELANRGRFPAVDVLSSVSRPMQELVEGEQRRAAAKLRGLLAAHAAVEDLVLMGEYRPGSNAEADLALERHGELMEFLRQDVEEMAPLEETRRRLLEVTR